ncbi:MAG: hypothetical protein ACRDQ7_14205 [Haloechinothrix sp.]
MAVIISSALALAVLVLLARREAQRKDERAAREGLVIDGRVVPPPPELDTGYHDPDRRDRELVPVTELIARERRTARQAAAWTTAPLPPVSAGSRWRPSPNPRSVR